jgi:hypothetical protein
VWPSCCSIADAFGALLLRPAGHEKVVEAVVSSPWCCS